MIRYIQNKNFIPKQFYDRLEQEKLKKENQIITIFLAFNIFLMPISINIINKIKESKVDVKTVESYSKHDLIDLEVIKMWVENIVTDDIDEAYIANNKGEIKITTLDKVKNLRLNNKIKISNLDLYDDGRYSLGVILNE